MPSSLQLEEAGDADDSMTLMDVDSWALKTYAESPLARLLGVARIDELRMRASAATDGTFRTQPAQIFNQSSHGINKMK